MSEPWWQITVQCRAEDTDAVGARLVGMTGQGIEETDSGELRSMATTEAEAQRIVGQLRVVFPQITSEIIRHDPVDWSVRWRDGIITRRFGRLVVTPTWLPVETTPDEVVVTIDPESAFGSGEHGSTRIAMALLERHLRPGQKVLDFGSGSGILAIAAARLGAASAIGIEVDAESMPIADANAARNGVGDRVGFLLGDAADLWPLAGKADLICSNILRTVNTLLLPTLRDALAPGGLVIFSGMETPEAELFRPVLAAQGWEIVDEGIDSGWWGVTARIG